MIKDTAKSSEPSCVVSLNASFRVTKTSLIKSSVTRDLDLQMTPKTTHALGCKAILELKAACIVKLELILSLYLCM